MVARVNGGIITDQMLKGRFRYFIMAGSGIAFTDTTSEGTVTVPGQEVTGDDAGAVTFEFIVGSLDKPQPVPLSVADRAFKIITERCTVSQMNIVSGGTEIHFAIEGDDNGWIRNAADVDDDLVAANMLAAIIADQQAGGIQGDANNLPVIPHSSNVAGVTYDMAGITIDEVSFELL